MADPISIIGLVASVITFVDFGVKVISTSKDVRSSHLGMPGDVHQLDLIINDIQKSHDEIRKGMKATQKLSEDESRILLMVQEAEGLYTQLRSVIAKLEVRDDARSKTLESLRVAFRLSWNQNDLKGLAERLEKLDQRIRINLAFALQLHQHSALMSKLKAIEDSQEALGIDHESKLIDIQDAILRVIKEKNEKDKSVQESKRQRWEEEKAQKAEEIKAKKTRQERCEAAEERAKVRKRIERTEKDKQIAFHLEQHISLKMKLKALEREHKTSLQYVRVIDSLYFPEVRRRFFQIPLADQLSNEWIFDSKATTFIPWLESDAPGDRLFYIYGKAGSGKSTLMKYIAESKRTISTLETWAGSGKLYTASYYFWNQGNEMQKSRLGLMQSLLYQLLRKEPQLIPSVDRKNLQHEHWEMSELIAAFERVSSSTQLDSKFCFFIDGLDEYDGDESDILPMLQIISASSHIKVCASSRPERIYDKTLRSDQWAFNIAKFTLNDMRQYVSKQLIASEKFRALASTDQKCHDLISDISEHADGVWLWVFLVTRDIVYEVDRDEPLSTLVKIVTQFPANLDEYFKRIIEKIKDVHKEEMAQTFLVTTHELQPMPLYAFALLQQERTNPNFFVEGGPKPISESIILKQHPIWRSRVQNRCGDLLVVEDHQAQPVIAGSRVTVPMLLQHPVDFLHRTVRDFLREPFAEKLQGYLKSDYNPQLSLCRMCLGMLNGLPTESIRNIPFANRLISLTDEMLYYAHEVEKLGSESDVAALTPLLDALDRTNTHHTKDIKNHWTHARDSPTTQSLDQYAEGGKCNFLALAIQARLVTYVRQKLDPEPHLMKKHGRPLLDYALRPRRMTPVSMPYHSDREETSIDIAMVEMLLARGADPNEPIHLFDGETVWAMFLISMLESKKEKESRVRGASIPDSLRQAWYKAAKALIEAGARSDRRTAFVHDVRIDDEKTDVIGVISHVFTPDEANKLRELIELRAKETSQNEGGMCVLM